MDYPRKIVQAICSSFFVQISKRKHSRDGKIDDGGILFNKKVILGESLDVEDKVWRKSG